MPETISLNTDIENLNLQSNKIYEVPGSISNLISLKVLNLSSNKISELH